MTSEKIGRYILDQAIGQGAMGVVYRAFDPVIERTVAIKTIRMDTIQRPADRDDFKSRFFKEARIAGRLHHPGIVVLHDIGEQEDMPFIVMELVEGRSLETALSQPKPLELREVWRILERVAEGLDYAHGHGVIHSDIKPQNIMLTHDGHAKILDFGIARLIENEQSRDSQYHGTPQYSSPEQITSQIIDHRTDLFALGILAHKLISGKDVYEGGNLKKTLFQIVYHDPEIKPPLPHLGIHTKRYLQIMTKALDRDPNKRYQKGGAFIRDLEEVFRNRSLVAPEIRGQQRDVPLEANNDVTQTIPPREMGQMLTERSRIQQRVKRLRKLRTAFEEAADAENLLACRDLVRRLEREEEDVDAERARIESIESAIEAREKAQMEQTVSLKRQEFHTILAQGKVAEAAVLLSRLREVTPDVTGESDQLQAKLDEQKEAREGQIQEERKQFQAALIEENLVKARTRLETLKKLGDEVESRERAYQSLEKRLKKKTHSHLNRINKIRKRFNQAAERQDPSGAARLIEELKSHNVSVEKEMQVLEGLEARRADALASVEADLKQALKKKDAALAERLLNDLRKHLLDTNPDGLTEYRTKLEKLRAKQRKKEIKEWEDEFERALDKGLEDQAHRAQRALARLGADSPKYQKLLARARGKGPVEEDPKTSWPLVITVGLVVAGLITWVLTRM